MKYLKLVLLIFLLCGFLSISYATTIFSDNMSSFPSGWSLSGTSSNYWTKSSSRYYSSSYSAKCTPNSSYNNNIDIYATRNINLSGYSSATLSFKVWQYTESGYDYIYVDYYNGSWNQVWSESGSHQSWLTKNVSIPISATKIRFRFHSDYSVTKEGAYIDDVVLSAEGGSTQNDAGSGGDAGDSFSSALSINPGSYSGYMDGSDRNDYYKFNVNSGDIIEVTLNPPTSADYDLYLYDPSGNQKASSTHGTGQQDAVTYTATSSGYWRARMYEYSGSGNYSFTVSVSGGSTTKKWTVIVYLNADNNLESYGISDFNEMEAAGSSDDINIIVQIDRATGYDNSNGNWTTCRRYYVTTDNNSSTINSTLISDIGEQDMGSPTTLKTFVNWAIDNYPADHYFVDVWDHGDGWYKDNGPESPLFKGASYDNSSGNEIDISNGELASALSGIKSHLGHNIDLLGFDACLMSMWEVMDVCKNYSDIFIGSEETEAADGWYYTSFLNALRSNPTMSAINLGKAVINGSSLATLAVTNLSQIPTVTSKVNVFAQKLIQARGEGYSSKINTARNNTRHFYTASHIDLYDFAYNIANSSVPSYLKTAANDVKSSVTNAVEATHNSSSYSDAYGIAIYHPASASDYDSRYNNLAITSTKWDEYLKGESGGSGSWTEVSYSVSSPHNYTNNYEHTWTITHSGATKMKVYFSSFNTETNYDFVYIYDGSNNQIARYDGNKGAFWSAEVPGDVVKVKLVTDYSVTRYGFDISKYSWYDGTVTSPQEQSNVLTRVNNAFDISTKMVNNKVSFSYNTKNPITVKIYNTSGKMVLKKLIMPGFGSKSIDLLNNNKRTLPSGIYFFKVNGENIDETFKIIKLR